MKITFLHISDFHYRPDWPEEAGLICRKFIEDLESRRDLENPYLIFSGDFVKAGGIRDQYTDLNTHIGAALTSAGFPPDRRICVPGNHDVSQQIVQDNLLFHQGPLSLIKDEQTFNDSVSKLADQSFGPKFANYRYHEAAFASFNTCSQIVSGGGWSLSPDVGVYCLNTALCSLGGAKNVNGVPMSDERQLMIDTRSLQSWLSKSAHSTRVMVMHHPPEWFCPWANKEIQSIIYSSFHLVFSGHVHEAGALQYTHFKGSHVHCVAPALFTRKSEVLGYSIVKHDISTKETIIQYRQWVPAPKQCFVAGTALSGTDSGSVLLGGHDGGPASKNAVHARSTPAPPSTAYEEDFESALTFYASKKRLWIDRDIATSPEVAVDNPSAHFVTYEELTEGPGVFAIRAPTEFGLTCLGRHIALTQYLKNPANICIFLDADDVPNHRDGTLAAIAVECSRHQASKSAIKAFIVDNWSNDKPSRRLLRQLLDTFPQTAVILLDNVDDCEQIAGALEGESESFSIRMCYLWALTRNRMRELVSKYLHDHPNTDDSVVTNKIVGDIDSLNIHRTPLNCLLLLKLSEQFFEDSPVNRTEIISRVLYLLFIQFDKIPRYATRPDIKDCEYALGYFCEHLVKSAKAEFSRSEFFSQINKYCDSHLLDLDVEVLFSFLLGENILVSKGSYFAFRFSYWLHYFAAHRMHHNNAFAEYILSDMRYSAFPEMIEFYAGIDRRRTDAVQRLAADLARLNEDFLQRTGISPGFNPLAEAMWTPLPDQVERLLKEVKESAAESSLPTAVKDQIADATYDRARPYNQALAKFIKETSLRQLVQSMKGAARALRNSDHVEPELKMELLACVLSSWVRVCQVMILLSPMLARKRHATFEDMGFTLDSTFDQFDTPEKRWRALMLCIVDNVVVWFKDDVFSRKMGALFSRFAKSNDGQLVELLAILVMIRQKAPGWEREVERFIVKSHKNSFYLNRVFIVMRNEFHVGFTNERTRQELRRLAAMALAKHKTGVKHPNDQLVERAAKETFDKASVKLPPLPQRTDIVCDKPAADMADSGPPLKVIGRDDD